MTREPYSDARAVEMAIKTSAEAAHRADPSVSVSERIRQVHFDRLLCRVFSEGDASTWILKGGTGVLARVPNARATLDIDLYINGYSLDQALTALRRLVSIDLGDYFRFEYIGYKQSLAGDQQPYTDGYRVTFETYLGTKKLTNIGIDLVVGPGDLDDIEVTDPANRTALPRLLTYPYRLYPLSTRSRTRCAPRLPPTPLDHPAASATLSISSSWRQLSRSRPRLYGRPSMPKPAGEVSGNQPGSSCRQHGAGSTSAKLGRFRFAYAT